MRIDLFLHRTGIVRRRSAARHACESGQVIWEGRPAKPSREVKPGGTLVVQSDLYRRAWIVRELPSGSRPRHEMDRYVTLLWEKRVEEDLLPDWALR